MSKIVFVSDTVEDNGKTIRENNLEIKHKLSIGDLVEIYWEDGEYNGVRLRICGLFRDCDGTPLYNLTANLENYKYNEERYGKNSILTQCIGGFSEGNLTKIT